MRMLRCARTSPSGMQLRRWPLPPVPSWWPGTGEHEDIYAAAADWSDDAPDCSSEATSFQSDDSADTIVERAARRVRLRGRPGGQPEQGELAQDRRQPDGPDRAPRTTSRGVDGHGCCTEPGRTTLFEHARLTDRMFSQARHGIMLLQNKYGEETKSRVNEHQVDLVEVCPRRNSPLRSEVEKLNGKYLGMDFSRPAGFRRAMMMLKEHKPRRVVLSPTCDCSRIPVGGAFRENASPAEKREKSVKTHKILRNSVLLAQFALELGCQIDFEQPARSPSWGYRPLRHLRSQLHEVRISGCMFGMVTETANG